MNVVYYIFSQALLFLSVLFYYYSSLDKNIKYKINYIFLFVIFIIILFLNEKYNCSLPITLDLFYNTIKNDTDTSLTPLSDSAYKNTITTTMLITLILTIINI